MSVSLLQATFTGGEFAPALWARTDLAKYATAAKTMLNFYPHPHGGASNRPGTEYVAALKNSAKKARLIPFQFSTVQSYILCFGDGTLRVFKDGGQIVLAATPAAYNGASTYGLGDYVSSSGVNYYSLQAANTGHTPASSPTWWYPLTGLIVEIPTPYLEADLPLLKFEQSADVIYLFHPSYAPRKLSRSSHTLWTLSTIAFGASVAAPTGVAASGGAGKTYAVTARTEDGSESVVSTEVTSAAGNTLTWTASAGAAEYWIYEKVDGLFQFAGKAAGTSYAIPASYTLDPDTAPPTANNPFSGADKYPGVGAFHEQRLIYARTNGKPQSFWGSVVGDFENLNKSSPIRDDDSFTFTINSAQVNEIRWMVSLRDLIIGTSGAEWKLGAGTATNGITPTSVQLSPQSRWGVSHLPPILVGNSVLFVDGSKSTVRDLTYSFQVDGYDGSDLTILAAHLFETYGIVEWAWQQHPDSVIWAVREDGILCALTYFKEHQVTGWSRHDTDGLFESVASIQTSEGETEAWVIVKRTIGGQPKRYVERFHARDFADIAEAFFVDSGLTYEGAPATEISGLDHLEGKAVVALADGNVVRDLTVASGKITLPNAASLVHVGLPYTCDLETLAFEFQTPKGTLQDKKRAIFSSLMRLRNTRACQVGPSADRLNELKFRSDEDYDEPTRLFSGDKEVFVDPGDARGGRLFVRVEDPLPITVQAVIVRMEGGAG